MWTVLAESLHLHPCCQSQAQNAISDSSFQVKNHATICIAGAFIVEFPVVVFLVGASGCFWVLWRISTCIHWNRRRGGISSSGSGAALRRTLTPRPAPVGEGYFTLREGEGGRCWLLFFLNSRADGQVFRNTTVVKVDECVFIKHNRTTTDKPVSDVMKKTSPW